jgi:hypothetical protein
MPDNKNNSKTRIPSVEETNAELAKEFAEQDSSAEDSLLKKSDSNAPNESSNQVPSRLKKQKKLFLGVQRLGQMDDPYVNQKEHISLPTVTRQMRTQESF